MKRDISSEIDLNHMFEDGATLAEIKPVYEKCAKLMEPGPRQYHLVMLYAFHSENPDYKQFLLETMAENLKDCIKRPEKDEEEYKIKIEHAMALDNALHSIGIILKEGLVTKDEFKNDIIFIGEHLLEYKELCNAYKAFGMVGADNTPIHKALPETEYRDLEGLYLESLETNDKETLSIVKKEMHKRNGAPVRQLKNTKSGPIEEIEANGQGKFYSTPKTKQLDKKHTTAPVHPTLGGTLGKREYETAMMDFAEYADSAGCIVGRAREDIIADHLGAMQEHEHKLDALLDADMSGIDTVELPSMNVTLRTDKEADYGADEDDEVAYFVNRPDVVKIPSKVKTHIKETFTVSKESIVEVVNCWLDRLIDVGMLVSFKYKGREIIIPSDGTVSRIFKKQGEPETYDVGSGESGISV
jgi:hypothetical protein